MYQTLLEAKKEIRIYDIEQSGSGEGIKVSGKIKTFLPVEKKLTIPTPLGSTEKISFMKKATFDFTCTIHVSQMNVHELTTSSLTLEHLKLKSKEEAFEVIEKSVKIDQKFEDQLKRTIPDSPYKAEQKEQFLKICEKIGDFELFKRAFAAELLQVLVSETQFKMVFSKK